jgi:protein-S-isoprenylcysteine O-methyltransferase Ste14
MSPESAEEPLVQPAPAAEANPSPPPSKRGRRGGRNMLPERDRRSPPERLLVRLIATCGIVGIGVAIAAIMHSSGSQGWMIGLVVSIVSVVLAAVLWSSRVL